MTSDGEADAAGGARDEGHFVGERELTGFSHNGSGLFALLIALEVCSTDIDLCYGKTRQRMLFTSSEAGGNNP